MKIVNEKKQLLILIMSIMLLICSVGTSFANSNLPVITVNNTTNNLAIVDENNVPSLNYVGNNKDDNSNNIATTNNVTNNSTSNTTNTAIPDTGLEEGSIVIIAICIISAIYAHKKIKDYNNF